MEGAGVGAEAIDGGLRLNAIDRNTPRLSCRLVSLAKNPSTPLSHDADEGVKWKVQRGYRLSHARTLGCLWDKRSCQRQTVVLAVSLRRMTSSVTDHHLGLSVARCSACKTLVFQV